MTLSMEEHTIRVKRRNSALAWSGAGVKKGEIARRLGLNATTVKALLSEAELDDAKGRVAACPSLPDEFPLERVIFTPRTSNVLKNWFKPNATVGDVRRSDDRDLLRMPNFGHKGLRELRDGLGCSAEVDQNRQRYAALMSKRASLIAECRKRVSEIDAEIEAMSARR
jgi:hypothetical protein